MGDLHSRIRRHHLRPLRPRNRVQLYIPCLGSIVLYDNKHHDDHHVYRRGNYASLLPVLDWLFGTEIVVRNRRLPGRVRWGRTRVTLAAVSVFMERMAELWDEHPECSPHCALVSEVSEQAVAADGPAARKRSARAFQNW